MEEKNKVQDRVIGLDCAYLLNNYNLKKNVETGTDQKVCGIICNNTEYRREH